MEFYLTRWFISRVSKFLICIPHRILKFDNEYGGDQMDCKQNQQRYSDISDISDVIDLM